MALRRRETRPRREDIRPGRFRRGTTRAGREDGVFGAEQIAPNFFWTRSYYTRIADLTDQIVVMTYDTAIPTPSLYRRYVAYVASSITSSVGQSRTRVMVGVPTYDETGLMHRAGVETPENALVGIVVGLRGVGGGGTFEGVALYAGWTTDDREWAVYERIWRGRRE